MSYDRMMRTLRKLDMQGEKAYLKSIKSCIDLEEAQQVVNGWTNFSAGIAKIKEGLEQL